MNIAIYSRKSKYSEKGESIDNQIQFCKDYAKMRMSHITEKNFFIYEDEGFSAANTFRPQFQKLISDIKSRKINILMCYRLDRINRNVSDFSKTLDLLEQYDVSFVSATENFDTATPMGKAMIYIASVFAQLERETTAERVRDNMLALSHTGRWLGGVTPYGYKSEAILYIDEDYKERQLFKLVPVETELITVKLLFYKYMELKSLSQVEQYCLTNHIKTQNNNDFTKSSISLILQNPTYCIADSNTYDYFRSLGCTIANAASEFDGKQGILCYNRTKHQSGKKQKKRPSTEWVVAIGKHEGIISGKDYTLVQNLIKNNKIKGSPRAETSSVALFSGKIICENCGSRLRVKNIHRNGNKVNFCYACEMKVLSKSSRCSISNIPGKQFDNRMLELVKDLLETDVLTYDYIPYLKKKESFILGATQEKNNRLYALRQEEHLIRNSIQNIIFQIGQRDNSLAEKYLIPKLEGLDNDLSRVQKEIRVLTNDEKKNETQQYNILSLYHDFTHLGSLIDTSDIELKRYLLYALIDTVKWNGNTAWVTLKTKSTV
ncbi:recombinase family protein [Anaerocolumna sedimenticola]|uniref:Recombinase family protein n=1 Tax=Anaerocolumna sedimenticola TaxID=2696063 RepID=A0A6P1TQS2_9FIRM|nr:recombinase family protein [Anaerocolumna sedimenticola]QHQ62833.1 recombinase family protein [Anaerocolumna sedimenticola]